MESNFEIQSYRTFEDIDYIINDFTAVTALLIDKGHTQIYASTDDIISGSKGKKKIAIVAVQEAHLALANSYKNDIKNKLWECEIFQTQEEAMIWTES